MYKTLIFDRARNCLKYLIRTFKIKEMFIPYYLCSVIRHSLFEEKCKPFFYHIDDNFMPAQDFPQESYILYPNYFGVFGRNVKQLVEKYPFLIVDNAHAYYDKPSGFACFNSGIKFDLGECANLWIKNSGFSQEFGIDNNFQKQSRLKKFKEIHNVYSDINQLNIEISEEMSPFVYPLLVSNIDNANKIVKDLKKDGFTIYRYWNSLPKSFNEYKFYSRLIPIPIINKSTDYPLKAQ